MKLSSLFSRIIMESIADGGAFKSMETMAKRQVGMTENNHGESSCWSDQPTPELRRSTFIHDTIEYLTGYYGMGSTFNRKRMIVSLGKMFDKHQKDIHNVQQYNTGYNGPVYTERQAEILFNQLGINTMFDPDHLIAMVELVYSCEYS